METCQKPNLSLFPAIYFFSLPLTFLLLKRSQTPSNQSEIIFAQFIKLENVRYNSSLFLYIYFFFRKNHNRKFCGPERRSLLGWKYLFFFHLFKVRIDSRRYLNFFFILGSQNSTKFFFRKKFSPKQKIKNLLRLQS